jgi:two-component system, cell cycle response regulator
MKILIADDDKVSLRLLQETLARSGYNPVPCTTGAEAWRILQQKDAPQLVILDWEMPGMDGPDVCRGIRRRGSEPYVYILLLTTRQDKQDIVEGMDAGADDYLIKPFDRQELEVRLRAGRRILELQNELILAREALREQANRDPLTGLLNRRAIVDVLAAEVRRAKRERRAVGIALADLDHFKRINDTHGHAAGDEVLREATRRMRASVRVYDEIGRYGGEEFLIVAPGCNGNTIALLAERIRTVVAGTPVLVDSIEIPMTCSLGIAANEGDRHDDPDGLIRTADAALYRAKDAGRDNVGKPAPPGNREHAST